MVGKLPGLDAPALRQEALHVVAVAGLEHAADAHFAQRRVVDAKFGIVVPVQFGHEVLQAPVVHVQLAFQPALRRPLVDRLHVAERAVRADAQGLPGLQRRRLFRRSEEHTSELQSLMRISYAVFCLKKKKQTKQSDTKHHTTKYSAKEN